MKKIDWKPVKDVAELFAGVVVYGLMVTAANKFADHITKIPESTIVRYDDAIRAIMNSAMWSSDKTKAAAVLKLDGDSSLYKSVIYVAENDSMYSSDKLAMIKELNKD